MACLGAKQYDPAGAVTQATSALLAMTALDTTNLRLAFTVPANGRVLARLSGGTHGATTFAQTLLGILEGSTVKARCTPFGGWLQSLATHRVLNEAAVVIPGLTPAANLTWDAAYGVEVAVAATGIKYGGPDNATTDDAFGAFCFEVWEATNCLGAVLYDPAAAVTKVLTSLLAMTAFDTTNARITFTAPASGKVFWRVAVAQHGSTTYGSPLLGVLESTTVRARSAVRRDLSSNAANYVSTEASGVINGLTPGNSYTFDAAYGVEVVAAAGGFKYGGPNDTTTINAFGGLQFEIWAA